MRRKARRDLATGGADHSRANLDSSAVAGYTLIMTQHVTAIYEHGVLRPLGPLDLRDHEVVTLCVESKNGGCTNAAKPTLFEVMDEAGLIGCITDAPPDLSTNPKYMEGFGKGGS